MASIREQVTAEIKTAMKAKQQERLGVLRMIKAEIIKKETAAGASELDEQGLIGVLQSMKKQRVDAADQFRKGGREELAAKEEGEIAVIETLLPAQLGDDELKAMVAETAAEVGATDMKGMGGLIKAVREKAAGQADGKRISEAVKAHLAG